MKMIQHINKKPIKSLIFLASIILKDVKFAICGSIGKGVIKEIYILFILEDIFKDFESIFKYHYS